MDCDIISALFADPKLLSCFGGMYSPSCLYIRIFLLLLNIGLSIFDCWSDWNVWSAVKNGGLNHPLLELPVVWIWLWLGFTVLGTVTAVVVILNEIAELIVLFNTAIQHHRHKDDSPRGVRNTCFNCWDDSGFNYITRSEWLSLINLISEDFPLLILTLLLDGISYSCYHPMLMGSDSSQISKSVLISSLASLADIGWCLVRLVVRIIFTNTRCRECLREKGFSDHMDFLYDNKLKRNCAKCTYKWLCKRLHAFSSVTCNVLAIIISIFAAAIVAAVFSGNGLFFPQSNGQLCIYHNTDDPQCLTNVSAIIASNSSGISLKEEFNDTSCILTLYYDPDEKNIKYNVVVTDLSSNQVLEDANVQCRGYYNTLFLGHNTTGGEVKRFDATCWGYHVISQNTASLKSDLS
jgi:hypothetical protein